jgi:hypothetical protein
MAPRAAARFILLYVFSFVEARSNALYYPRFCALQAKTYRAAGPSRRGANDQDPPETRSGSAHREGSRKRERRVLGIRRSTAPLFFAPFYCAKEHGHLEKASLMTHATGWARRLWHFAKYATCLGALALLISSQHATAQTDAEGEKLRDLAGYWVWKQSPNVWLLFAVTPGPHSLVIRYERLAKLECSRGAVGCEQPEPKTVYNFNVSGRDLSGTVTVHSIEGRSALVPQWPGCPSEEKTFPANARIAPDWGKLVITNTGQLPRPYYPGADGCTWYSSEGFTELTRYER